VHGVFLGGLNEFDKGSLASAGWLFLIADHSSYVPLSRNSGHFRANPGVRAIRSGEVGAPFGWLPQAEVARI